MPSTHAPGSGIAASSDGLPDADRVGYVPTVTNRDLTRRNAAAVRLLDAWETEGDEAEQRETMRTLREALATGRVASSRPLFP